MQRTGLVIKLGLVLGALLGTVVVQRLAAHSLAHGGTVSQQSASAETQVQIAETPEAAALTEPTLDVGSHASPVPETSTSVGFGGMLALGFGLIAVRRWKSSRDTQNSTRQTLELP
jgi:hypothetical protein